MAGGEAPTKALLETDELILRGGWKGRWPLGSLSGVTVDGDWLALTTPDGPLALKLGAKDATSWAKKMSTPPPTLAEKLGIGADRRVQVVGEIEDAALEEAVATALAPAGEAKLSLGVVLGLADIDGLLAAHARLPADAAVWIVNVKGPDSPLGENAIRSEMRSRGYMDNKTASVSTRLAATRYARRKA
jgi:hypothetical protein